MTQNSPILSVNHLTTEFKTKDGSIKAVDDISFNLQKGESLGIVGESGSGKSVTSLSIMQLVESPGIISQGQIFFGKNGEKVDLVSLPEREMRHHRGKDIAMIFQEPMSALNPVMRCGKQVQEAILIHQDISKEEAKNRVLELFEEVSLPEPSRMYDAYPHQLSGGQIQRVMIAMALSCNPAILIADEPTTALDVTVQKGIINLLKRIQKTHGTSIIFISHDLGVINEIADRVLVMFKGKIVEKASVKQLFSHPAHPYSKSLIACRPPLEYKLKRLPIVSDFMLVSYASDGSFKIDVNKERIELKPIHKDVLDQRNKQLMSKEPILSVRDLRVWYPKKKNFLGKVLEYTKAVNEVNFNVYKGETLGLVGESGCGKSTLGRTLIKLLPPISGTAHFKGEDLFKLENKRLKAFRKQVQIIFQDPYSSLNPRMQIGQAIAEPMEVHQLFSNSRERKEQVVQLLELVDLHADHLNRYPHQFSGGQRQRICIARALAVNPEFLICDESVSALDVSVQAQVLNLLIELREKLDLSMIFISHDLSVVKFISDRIMVMNNGEIVESGWSEDIYHRPKQDYTKKLIEAIPKIHVNKL